MASIRNETGAITTDPAEIRRVISKCYQILCTHKFDNSGEVDKFSETQTITLVMTDELTSTHHHYSSPNCTLRFNLGVGHPMGLDKCAMYTYPLVISYTGFPLPETSSVLCLSVSTVPALSLTGVCSISIVVSFQKVMELESYSL